MAENISEELPNFVISSSQSSDLGQEQLDEIEKNAQAKSTKRATEWGLKNLRSGAISEKSS